MKYRVAAFLGVVLFGGWTVAGAEGPVLTPGERVNYSLGHQIGQDLATQGLELDSEAFLQGVQDALEGSPPRWSRDEMEGVLQALKKNIVEQNQTVRRQQETQVREGYRGEGRAFLARNAQREEVVALPSGLQYQVLEAGDGASPGPHDTVAVRYRGTLLDGTEFDRSGPGNEPAEFRVDGVIPGWTEALQLMQEGSRWRLFIPADLAYGERGPLADRSVIFDVELVSVRPSP